MKARPMATILPVNISHPDFINWLEDQVLPPFFRDRQWFGGRSVSSDPRLQVIELGISSSGLILILVDQLDADRAQSPYFLACVAVSYSGHEIKNAIGQLPASITPSSAVLVDASETDAGREELLKLATGEMQLAWSSGQVQGRLFESRNILAEKAAWRGRGRLTDVEQSNTSVIYSDQAILKLLRRPGEPGEPNPDVEIPLALSLTTELPLTPPVMGVVQAGPDDRAVILATLCRYLPDSRCGWEMALAAATKAMEADFDGSGETSGDDALLGRDLAIRTAELHVALARIADNEAFKPISVKPVDVAALGHEMLEECDRLFQKISSLRLDAFDMQTFSQLFALLDYQPKIRKVFEKLIDVGKQDDCTIFFNIRVHGDYHLGQLLHDKKLGWQVIDFEGEPDRPMPQRRLKQNVLKDLAGMLRSFDYAQAMACERAGACEDRRRRAKLWRDQISSIFSNTYLAMAGDVENEIFPLLPPAYQLRFQLLDAYVLQKNLYELAYEIDHRPSWVHVPLTSLIEWFGEVS
jgi:maltose alpha-D-glucosyltransferase/alpha-amylase